MVAKVAEEPQPKKKSFLRRVWDNGGRTAAIVGGSLLGAGLLGHAVARGRRSRTGSIVGKAAPYMAGVGFNPLFAADHQMPWLKQNLPTADLRPFPDFPGGASIEERKPWQSSRAQRIRDLEFADLMRNATPVNAFTGRGKRPAIPEIPDEPQPFRLPPSRGRGMAM